MRTDPARVRYERKERTLPSDLINAHGRRCSRSFAHHADGSPVRSSADTQRPRTAPLRGQSRLLKELPLHARRWQLLTSPLARPVRAPQARAHPQDRDVVGVAPG